MDDRQAPHRGRAAALLATLAALAVLAAACNSGSGSTTEAAPTADAGQTATTLEPDATPETGGSLVVGLPAETNGWNPYVAQWADAGSFAGSSMIESLTRVDKDANPVGVLATSWAPNADFTQWEINLRPGVVFHDGTPFDAEAVKKNLDFSYSSGLASTVLKTMYQGVEIVDSDTVRVTLQRPWAAYPSAMAQSGWMLAPAMYDLPNSGSDTPIGTGPFKFESWKRDNQLRVVKFGDYWGKDEAGNQLPYLDNIEFRVITDDDTKFSSLRTGDVQMFMTANARVATQAESEFTVIKDWGSERTFVMLNADPDAPGKTKNPFSNVHARRALAHATDQAAIRALVGEGLQTTTSPWIATSKFGLPNEQSSYPAYDPEKAKEELALYTQETGEPTLSFTLSGLTTNQDTQISQALTSMWSDAGIDVQLESIEQASFIGTVVFGQYQAALFRLYGWPDPDSDYSFFVSDTVQPIGGLSINFTHYSDPQLDELWSKSRTTADFDQRKGYYDEIARTINEASTHIWLYDTPYSIVASPRVRGLNPFRTEPFGHFLPKPFWGEMWLQRQ